MKNFSITCNFTANYEEITQNKSHGIEFTMMVKNSSDVINDIKLSVIF